MWIFPMPKFGLQMLLTGAFSFYIARWILSLAASA